MSDEWEKMVADALDAEPQQQDLPKKPEESEADESGEYVSSESDDDTISTSSCDSQEWAPTKPRLPIALPMDSAENFEEPDDAEEAVRAAGLGMQQLSISDNAYTPPARSSVSLFEDKTKPPVLLPVMFAKLQKVSKRFESSEMYSLVTPVALVPYPTSLKAKVTFEDEPVNVNPPASFSNTIESIPSANTSFEMSSIPYISLLTIMSSTLGCRFRQSWIIPFSVRESSSKGIHFYNPIHDDPIDRNFAHYKLAYLGAHSIYTTQKVAINGTDLTITDYNPLLFAFKGSDALSSALSSFYRDGTLCHMLELFGMSAKSTGACPAPESEYHKGKNVMAHILKRLLELPCGEYFLVHRSDEALCYVCTSNPDAEKDIDLSKEMPAPMTLTELNQDA